MDSKRTSGESEIHGTTLRVYWFLFRNVNPVGVRETQRALSLSSASVALYHLEKLREIGVVDKDDMGQYRLKEKVQVGSLKMLLRVGHIIFPRYLFYAVLLTTALAVYGGLEIAYGETVEVPAIIFGLLGAAISWYECIRMWREQVF
jgi:DNA-binding transcriptional ArsR family regulator